MYNDGYLGTWWDYGTWAGDFKRERGVEMLKTFENHPYGGEMAYIGRDWLEKNMGLFQLEKWNIVKEWYDTHLNYLRNIGERGHTLADFLTNDLVFDSKRYAFDGMPNLAEYDGQTMNKFVRDHLFSSSITNATALLSNSTGGISSASLIITVSSLTSTTVPVKPPIVRSLVPLTMESSIFCCFSRCFF